MGPQATTGAHSRRIAMEPTAILPGGCTDWTGMNPEPLPDFVQFAAILLIVVAVAASEIWRLWKSLP